MATVDWLKEALETKKLPFREVHHPGVYTAEEVTQSKDREATWGGRWPFYDE